MHAKVHALLLASRPKTLSAAVIPVLVGTAVAIYLGELRLIRALAALFGAVMIQVGTNFANDLFDARHGADTEGRVGPVRAVQAGLLSPQEMAVATTAAFLLASLAGIYLTYVAGWGVVVVGLASILSGVAYTAGPKPLGYIGLGDIFVFFFFGVVAVMMTTYVQVLSVSVLSWWVSIPIGALSTAILTVNNIRDREQDSAANKNTLVVKFGRIFGVVEYWMCLGVAFLVPLGLVIAGYGPWVLLSWVSLPLAYDPLVSVVRDEGPVLNATLGATARLLLVYGVLLAVGLVLSRLVLS
ncbi:MAG: 1,4-dihydroxy-2-naphthoate polyprenyltransferase [Myxococcales bacterium]|nr:1,4-dihydroxy-2-naphthoate polyprenyltransferase [Myxococcales bacterium]